MHYDDIREESEDRLAVKERDIARTQLMQHCERICADEDMFAARNALRWLAEGKDLDRLKVELQAWLFGR